MNAPPPPPGVQPERTALAWQRTALAVAVGSLAAGRLLEPRVGSGVWVAAAAGVLGGLALGVLGGRRARAWAAAMADEDRTPPPAGPGGGLLAGLALGVLVLGVAAAVLVLG